MILLPASASFGSLMIAVAVVVVPCDSGLLKLVVVVEKEDFR